MNSILEHMITTRENYVHALEVYSTPELESLVIQMIDTFDNFSVDTIAEFILSLDITCLDDNNAEQVYRFWNGLDKEYIESFL